MYLIIVPFCSIGILLPSINCLIKKHVSEKILVIPLSLNAKMAIFFREKKNLEYLNKENADLRIKGCFFLFPNKILTLNAFYIITQETGHDMCRHFFICVSMPLASLEGLKYKVFARNHQFQPIISKRLRRKSALMEREKLYMLQLYWRIITSYPGCFEIIDQFTANLLRISYHLVQV